MGRAAVAAALLLLGCDHVDEVAASEDVGTSPLIVGDSMGPLNEQSDERVQEVRVPALEEGPSEPRAVPTISVAEMRRSGRGRFESPEERDSLWDLEHLPQAGAEETALLRIWMSEVELTNERDMIAIWQVAQNIRSRQCDNTRFSAAARRVITQCRTDYGEVFFVRPGETWERAEETTLSALRRLSERAVGAVTARSARGAWIAGLTADCSVPRGWPETRGPWDEARIRRLRADGTVERVRVRQACEEAVVLARDLVAGTQQRSVTSTTLIAWGGRCETVCDDPTDPTTCSDRGACDDRVACRRGLARVRGLGTTNAFWCRPGTTGCAETRDPICDQFDVVDGTI